MPAGGETPTGGDVPSGGAEQSALGATEPLQGGNEVSFTIVKDKDGAATGCMSQPTRLNRTSQHLDLLGCLALLAIGLRLRRSLNHEL